MTKIRITAAIAIDESELDEQFVLASGPGGQNVNKVASAVQLRFNAARCPALPEAVRHKLISLAGRRATKDGVIVIVGRQFRDQIRNRADVRDRLIDLIRRAATPKKPRHPTEPTRASKERHLDAKKRQSRLKRARSKPGRE